MLVLNYLIINQDDWRRTCSHYSTMMIPNLFTVRMRRSISTLLRAHATKLIYTGYTCLTIGPNVIFGTLKDGSPEINSLAINNNVQVQKRLPKWRQRFVKNG